MEKDKRRVEGTVIRGDFYFRKSNWTKFKNNGRDSIILFSRMYLDDIKERPGEIMIRNKFYVKDKMISLSKEEADNIKNIWDNINISETVDKASIYSCMRYDNKQLKHQYKDLSKLKDLLFIRKITKPEGNFEGYKCYYCKNYHIGKNSNIIYKRNLREKIAYFVDQIRYYFLIRKQRKMKTK